MAKAGPVLLEPISPDRGHRAGELCRATCWATSTDGGAGCRAPTPPTAASQVITALVPTSEIQRYAIDLRSLTGGRGRFHAEHDHYDLVDRLVKAKAD
jgi:elongation factor G